MSRKISLSIKFVFDIIGALVLLVILFPIGILIAVAIKIDYKGSVFFRQKRAGLRDKQFWIYKFRSMVVNADSAGPIVSLNDPRVTRVGRFLRLSSLDELPQLINILRGEMSLVGPRALIKESIKPEEIKRLEFRPGITSLAAVKGRQSLTWEQRMNLDLWYVQNWSLWLDLKIFFRTIPIVLFASNVYDRDGEMKVRK